jgi:hypothetical protein
MKFPKWKWGKATTLRFWVWFSLSVYGIMVIQQNMPSATAHAHPLRLIAGAVFFLTGIYNLNN